MQQQPQQQQQQQGQQWGGSASSPAAAASSAAAPRPLMDIPTAPPSEPPLPDVAALRDRLAALNTQQRTLREQIMQSEGNLSAQERVTQQTQATLQVDAVKKARWDKSYIRQILLNESRFAVILGVKRWFVG